MAKTIIMDHPLIRDKIGLMRSEDTGTTDFRRLTEQVAMLITYEATKNLKLDYVKVKTPITETAVERLSTKLVAAPILRAGDGMLPGFQAMVPTARVAHIGLYRDPETHKPKRYYFKYPKDGIGDMEIFILDPMLATGGSAVYAVDLFKELKVPGGQIHFLGIIAAPEGLEVMQKAHPDVDLFIGALDDRLNEDKYIVPGLGDAGDRIFGTK